MFGSTAQVFRATSNGAWIIAQVINRALPEGRLPSPKWAPGRLPKRGERMPMGTGVPRRTLSLCPDCNREAVNAVVRGVSEVAEFRGHPGIIDAEILEEGGRILIRKACERHGPFEDVLSNHPDFFQRMEELSFGGDFNCVGDREVHNHGPNSIRAGRGSYLIVDLTNRCNMMCSPCYMDANGVGYVHEIGMEDVKAIFGRAASFKPRREINILFSGGEATLSPVFFDAVRHAKSMGFHRLHVATNGIRFAESRDFALEARAAGLHGVYLQFDGVSEEKNRHRGLGNFMAVKLRALENIAAAGMRATLQVTVVNGLNNDGIGEIVGFAVQNIDKIHGVILQPVMFSGRDESISTEERYARRYPLSQIAYDLRNQTSIDWQPMRDWFPASAYAIFAHLSDVLDPGSEQGSLFPDTHPDHAIFSPLLVDTENKEVTPIPTFFNLEQFMRDVVEITDSGRRPRVTKALLLLSLLRNFNQSKAPSGFDPSQFRAVLEDCFYRFASGGDDWSRKAYVQDGRWRVMFVNATWFQDIYTYELSTISNSSTPVATQEGEIGFSAYNAAGWRKVLESVHRTATMTEWYRNHGRHEIYTRGKKVELPELPHGRLGPLVQVEADTLAAPTGRPAPCEYRDERKKEQVPY